MSRDPRKELAVSGVRHWGVALVLLAGLVGCRGPSYETGMAEARRLVDQGRDAEALERLLDLQRRFPDRKEPYLYIGGICESERRPEVGIPVLRRAVERADANEAVYRFELAVLQEVADARDEAEVQYRTAIRLDPGLAPAYSRLGQFLQDAGRLADAVGVLAEAVRRFPREAEIGLQYAEALMRSGRRTEARAIVTELAGSPRAPDQAPYLLGLIDLLDGEDANARRELERATTLAPGDGRAWYQLAHACQRLGDGQAAEHALERFEPLLRARLADAGSGSGSAEDRASGSAAAPGPRTPPPDGPPNLILVSIDTLRADGLGCYGNPRPTSPAVDRLAREGVLFRNAFAASNWTLPSHYTMLSGLYPSAHGVNPDRARFGGFREPTHVIEVRGSGRESMLAERLARLGYRTAAITEDGWVHPRFGFDRGFDSFVADPDGRLASTRGRVLDWLREHRGQRFFLFVHTYEPHQPYDAAPPYDTIFIDPSHRGYALPGEIVPVDVLKDFQPGFFTPMEADVRAFRGLYDGEVRYVDDFMAVLRATLETEGLAGRTVVVFTSDHGEEIFEHGRFDHGDTLYDEVMRVPLIFWGPGRLQAGSEVRTAVSLVDLLPTLVELAGGEIEPPVQGTSLAGVLRGRGGLEARTLFGEGFAPGSVPIYCARSGAEKYILSAGNPVREELYDLERDPGERHDLAAARPAALGRLRAETAAWLQRCTKLRGPTPPASHRETEAPLDPEVLDRLRSLGYVK